ncbi:hypothetical protein ACB098_05G219300 [Castanea mollissima]
MVCNWNGSVSVIQFEGYDCTDSLNIGLPMYLVVANRITPSEMRRSCTVALDCSVNLSKNCYSDVIPFDKNRVVLNSCKDYRL